MRPRSEVLAYCLLTRLAESGLNPFLMLQQMIQCQGMVPQAIVQTKFDAHPMHVPREDFQIGFLSSQSSHHGKFGDKA